MLHGLFCIAGDVPLCWDHTFFQMPAQGMGSKNHPVLLGPLQTSFCCEIVMLTLPFSRLIRKKKIQLPSEMVPNANDDVRQGTMHSNLPGQKPLCDKFRFTMKFLCPTPCPKITLRPADVLSAMFNANQNHEGSDPCPMHAGV